MAPDPDDFPLDVPAPPPGWGGTPEGDETRARMLRAALGVFLTVGTAGARMQQIADAAGVSKAALHYYFRTKERLADEVFEWAAAQWLNRLATTLNADDSLEDMVRRLVRVEAEAIAEMPMLSGYVQAELHHDPVRRVQSLKTIHPVDLPRLQAKLDAAAAAGEIAPTRAEHFVIDLTCLAISPLTVPWVHHILLGMTEAEWDALVETRVEHVVQTFFRALGRRDA